MLEIGDQNIVSGTTKVKLDSLYNLNTVSVIENLRIRRFKAVNLPYLSDCNHLDEIILLDSAVVKSIRNGESKVVSTEPLSKVENNENEEVDPITGCRLAGDPLRFEYLTLEKLLSMDTLNNTTTDVLLKVERSNKYKININPLSKENFTAVEEAMIAIKNQIPKKDVVAVAAVYNCDNSNETGCLFYGSEINYNERFKKTFDTIFLGNGKQLNSNLFNILSVIDDTPKSSIFVECEYEIIPAIESDMNDYAARISSQFSVTGYWQTKSIKTIPSHPENLSHMMVKYVSGWYDRRVTNINQTYMLHFLRYVAGNLEKGESVFGGGDNADIENEIIKWLDDNKVIGMVKHDNRELDFTEQLWLKLNSVTNIRTLQYIFKEICLRISSGTLTASIHRDNNSTIGALLRDPLHIKKFQSSVFTWESLQSTNAFMEIGFEYIFRQIMHEFKELEIILEKNEKSLYYDVLNESEAYKKIHNTFPFYLALQFAKITIKNICDIQKQFLSRLVMSLILKYKKMTVQEMFSYVYTFKITIEDGCHFRFYDRDIEPDIWTCELISEDKYINGRKTTSILKLQKFNDLEMLNSGIPLNTGITDKYVTSPKEEDKLNLYFGTYTTVDEMPFNTF
uniref:Protein zwilch n=1 Tax=Parastrongyloides trichosuri TaxID=131310 RepID=A0A0N5A5A6_PARTI